jgi:hypothetical protein
MRTNISASSGIRSHGSSVLSVRYGVPVTNIFINPLKPKLIKIINKDSGRTSKRTHPVTITSINFLTLFKKIIAVYTDNHTETMNKNAVVGY